MLNAQAVLLAGLVDNPAWWARTGALDERCLSPGFRELFKYVHRKRALTREWLVHHVETRSRSKAVRSACEELTRESPSAGEWGLALDEVLRAARREVLRVGLERSAKALTSNQARAEDVAHKMHRALLRYDGSAADLVSDARGEARHALGAAYGGPRMRTGITRLDEVTGGLRWGQFCLWAGYTHHAKTTFSVHVAHRLLMEGRNVLFGTLEMSKEQIEFLMLTVHSHVVHPGPHREPARGEDAALLSGLPFEWFDDADLRAKLPAADREKIAAVQEDFASREGMGQWRTWETPLDATALDLFSLADQVAAGLDGGLDAVFFDYLALLQGTRDKMGDRERLEDILKRSAGYAKRAQGGRGVLLWSPWQIKRAAYEKCVEKNRQRYALSDLSESSYAEKATDLIGWNFLPRGEGIEGEASLMRMGVMKNRTTRRLCEKGFWVQCREPTCMFRDVDEDQAGALADSEVMG